MRSYFRKIAQTFELKRVGGAPKGHQFAPLDPSMPTRQELHTFKALVRIVMS